jgi:DNA-binding transcriptional regulator YhcF (GntR family)
MRNVLPTSELCHKWANMEQESGRNANDTMFFNGSTIYSYGHHFAIAKHIVNEQGQRAVLFTQRDYSNTTAKHKSHVYMSCKNDNIIYCYDPSGSHNENFKYWEQRAEQDGTSKLAKARKPEKYLSILASIENKANIYALYFGIEIPETLKAILSIKDKSEFIAFADKKAEYIKAEQKKREAEQKKQFKEQIKKWLNLESDRLSIRYKFDFLRINDNRIETTQAVQIPLELGKRLYNSIKNQSLKVGDKVLNYSVNEVGKEIKIGCHTFKQSYLLKFGSQLV